MKSPQTNDWSHLIGTRIGKWTVTGLGTTRKYGRCRARTVRCVCDCGKIADQRPRSLLSGISKSCGCWRNHGEDAAFHRVWNNLTGSAKIRGISVEMPEDEAREIMKQNCVYCGDAPSQIAKVRSTSVLYNGLDRRDNSLGYSSFNVVPCCGVCNWMKSNMSAPDFFARTERIYKRFTMVSDNYVKSQLVSLAWDAASHISFPAIAAVMFCVKNQVDANKDGDWLKVITKITREQSFPPRDKDVRSPEFQNTLEIVDHIFDGSKVDRLTNGGTQWWAGVARERTAVVGSLEIYK